MISKVVVISKDHVFTLFSDKSISVCKKHGIIKGPSVYLHTKGRNAGIWSVTDQVKDFFRSSKLQYGQYITFGELLFEIPCVNIDFYGNISNDTMSLLKQKFERERKYRGTPSCRTINKNYFRGLGLYGWKERHTNDRKKDVE